MRPLTPLLLLLLHAAPAAATTIVARDVTWLAQASTHVVHATALGDRTELRDGTPWTHTALRVHGWLVGDGPPEVEVSRLGGPLGDGRTLRLDGDLALRPGDEVVLFLVRDGERYLPTLLSWSALHVEGERLRRRAALDAVPDPTARPDPASLDALTALLRAPR